MKQTIHVKRWDIDLPIFINPDEKEQKTVKEIPEMVRGVFNTKTGDVYIWQGNLSHHSDVIKALSLPVEDMIKISKYRELDTTFIR
jgi:hypothetical protein